MAIKTQTNMYPQLHTITPDLAVYWLKYNTGNRKLPVGNADYYARLIESDELILTHQALAFTGTPSNPQRLIDGQTRLTAVIKSGKPITQWVFWNCPEEVFAVTDNGKTRTFSDHYGWDKQQIAFVNILHWLSPAKLTKISKTEADKIWGAFGKEFQYLMEVCPSCRKGFSASAIRAATVMAMVQNPDRAVEIADQYRSLLLGKIEELQPSVGRLMNKLISVVGGGREAIMVQFPFTHKAMTPKNWQVTKLYGPDEQYFNQISLYIKEKANL